MLENNELPEEGPVTNKRKRETALRIQQALLDRLGEEVDLVFQYGSILTDRTHRFSDVDASYVPRHESTGECITVLVEDILFDLYPLHWSTLESMAEWTDWRGTILRNYLVTYSRNAEATERLRRLAARHRELGEPEHRPEMVRKALSVFARTGKELYELARAVEASDFPSARHHGQRVFDHLVHALALCNQTPVDTRKIDEIADLARLPEGFPSSVDRFLSATGAAEILSTARDLSDATRALLLEEQRDTLKDERSLAEILATGYTELKADLQRILIACEMQDKLCATAKCVTLLHELSYHLAVAADGVAYSDFNSPSDYRIELAELGFPELLEPAARGEFAELSRRALAFDRHMRDVLTAGSVGLFEYDSLEELEEELEVEPS